MIGWGENGIVLVCAWHLSVRAMIGYVRAGVEVGSCADIFVSAPQAILGDCRQGRRPTEWNLALATNLAAYTPWHGAAAGNAADACRCKSSVQDHP
jgi:hypothetical protein